MIATITKRYVTIGHDLTLVAGEEVEVTPHRGSTVAVTWYNPNDPTDSYTVANVNASWFASIAVYRRAKDLGYE